MSSSACEYTDPRLTEDTQPLAAAIVQPDGGITAALARRHEPSTLGTAR